ncbi:aminotransferase [Cubamyces lactineus]|nr:aminotransferase [Cubamyces lactineus]
MSSPPAFALLSTTRYEPHLRDCTWNTAVNGGLPSPYMLLRYHYERLLDAAQVHGWPIPQQLSLSRLEEECNAEITKHGSSDPLEQSFRIRILLSYAGALSVTASPTSPFPLPSHDPTAPSLWLPSAASDLPVSASEMLVLHLDILPTPSSNFTRTKTTHRDHYTSARGRFNIPPPPTSSIDEVLLFNESGDLTETSIRNVAFVRRSPPCWVTPHVSTGCLPGVMRRWLLEQGRVVEAVKGELTRDGVVDGEYVLTFNGVEGCRVGRVKVGE